MPSINMYTKEQVDAKVPPTTNASAGNVLTLDSNKDAVWQAPSGGGITAHSYATYGEMYADMHTHSYAILRLDASQVTFNGNTSSDKCHCNPSFATYENSSHIISGYITMGCMIAIDTNQIRMFMTKQIADTTTSTSTSETVDCFVAYLGRSYNPPTVVANSNITIPISAWKLYY